MSAGRSPRLFIDNIRYHRNGSGIFQGYACVRFRWRSGGSINTLIATVDRDENGVVQHVTVIDADDPFARYDPDFFLPSLTKAIDGAGDEQYASNATDAERIIRERRKAPRPSASEQTATA